MYSAISLARASSNAAISHVRSQVEPVPAELAERGAVVRVEIELTRRTVISGRLDCARRRRRGVVRDGFVFRNDVHGPLPKCRAPPRAAPANTEPPGGFTNKQACS